MLDLGDDGESVPGTEQDLRDAAALPADQPLDARGTTLMRKEQGFLRQQLFGGRREGTCTVCGERMPVNLLVAAHIKKRSECTHAERLDYRNNVVAMCKLGCDDLFERGYIVVCDGLVHANPAIGVVTPAVTARLQELDGKPIRASAGALPYLQWHGQHHGRGLT